MGENVAFPQTWNFWGRRESDPCDTVELCLKGDALMAVKKSVGKSVGKIRGFARISMNGFAVVFG